MRLSITVWTDDGKEIAFSKIVVPMKNDEATIWATHSINEAVKYTYKIDAMDDDDEDGPRVPLVPLLRDVEITLIPASAKVEVHNALVNGLEIDNAVAVKIIEAAHQGVCVKVAEKETPEEAMRVLEILEAAGAKVRLI